MTFFSPTGRLDAVATTETAMIFTTAPHMERFCMGQWTDRRHFTRYLIELVLRARLNNQADAYCLYRLGNRDGWLARELSAYLAQEYTHEDYALGDLAALGVEAAEVNRTRPLLSTEQLIGYLYVAGERDGPMPNVVWNWYQQWFSDRYDGLITGAAGEAFGPGCVAGSVAHARWHVDQIIAANGKDRYADTMAAQVRHLIATKSDAQLVEHHLRRLIRLWGASLSDLNAFASMNG
ncbi:MAG: hypothetical protein WB764_10155 [Xanthobacteraceae bacterium]